MRTVYVDSESKCHTVGDGTMTAIEEPFFQGKCDAYVEGFCYEVRGDTTAIYAWKPYEQLAQAQREYEIAMRMDMQQALSVLGVKVDG